MHRIDTDTRDVDEHGTGKDGFTAGDPGAGIAPTDLTADWFDDVQENLAQFIESMGLTLSKGAFDQLGRAIKNISRKMQALNWSKTEAVLGGSLVGAVAWDPAVAKYVAVGSSGKISHSEDGETWTAATDSGVTTTQDLRMVVSDGAGTLVAVGASGTVIHSSDGDSWTDDSAEIGETHTFLDVVWDGSNGSFIAVGTDGMVYTSPDGDLWTDRTIAALSGNSINSVDVQPDGVAKLLAAAAVDEAIWTSTDGGATWSVDGSAMSFGEAIAYSEGDEKWLATEGLGGAVWEADKGGTTWTDIGATGLSDSEQIVSDGGSLWIVINGGDGLFYSLDRVTWRRIALPGEGAIGTPTYAGSRFFYPALSGELYRSLAR